MRTISDTTKKSIFTHTTTRKLSLDLLETYSCTIKIRDPQEDVSERGWFDYLQFHA